MMVKIGRIKSDKAESDIGRGLRERLVTPGFKDACIAMQATKFSWRGHSRQPAVFFGPAGVSGTVAVLVPWSARP